jgi:hypothetical protein
LKLNLEFPVGCAAFRIKLFPDFFPIFAEFCLSGENYQRSASQNK